MISLVMRTKHDVVERKSAAQQIVHPIELAPRLITSGQPRLIGRGNENESDCFELFERFGGGRDDFEFLEADGGDLLLGTGAHLVQNRVALNENRSLHAWAKA